MGQKLSIRKRNPLSLKNTRRNDALTAPSHKRTADILKLNDDCFEAVFDYLTTGELIRVGATCKRLQQVAGRCFYKNYSVYWFVIKANDLKILGYSNDVTHFAQFVGKLEIRSHERLEYLLNNQSRFQRLKQIRLWFIEGSEVDRMAGILNKVEDLRFHDCELSLLELAVHCPNLRHLEIFNCNSNFDFFNQNHPKLEYFKFDSALEETEFVEKMLGFLERNPNIRKFATRANLLWANRNFIKKASDIKLDELAIFFSLDKLFQMDELCQFMNELYARGFYKRLQVYYISLTSHQEMIDHFATFNGLGKLYIHFCVNPVTLPAMSDLDELYIHKGSAILNVDSIANKLKRIHFMCAESDDIVPFIRRVPTLEEIRIDRLEDRLRANNDTKVIDLVKLNRERQQLANARKTTIYVGEDAYLATKWTMKETNLDLIRLKRQTSFEWGHDFYC